MLTRSGQMIRFFTFAVLLAALAGPALPQTAPAPPQPPEWLQFMAKSLQALPQYTFKQNTVMKMKGEIKSNTLNQVLSAPTANPRPRSSARPRRHGIPETADAAAGSRKRWSRTRRRRCRSSSRRW